MRIALVALVAALVGLSSSALAKDQIYGKGISAADTMRVSTLLANPDAYVGKLVRVQGIAVDVCQHRGCWVNVSSDVEGQVVRVKVKDGEIVFPPEILGNTIIAEGIWTANKLDLESTKMVCERDAQAEGKEFDPNSVTECMTLYQITGVGALVHPTEGEKKATES
ncbi:MAG: DUF4920 domain-containing protein [Candidatus Eisenbacteria bacterium]|uniref:DUF4920 domain-containing protein n=1 Tax=Eiseniibacteriota bacterium TaxID=2212470 RepID=A0A956RR43_UNCEI|nr:DUF4920 domain-containing protein [Candidatus Eisenbacteria bacterium]